MYRACAAVRTLAILGSGGFVDATGSLRGLSSLQEYCPRADEINGGGCAQLFDGGWTVTGGCRVSSKGVFNVLGGYYEFDMDLSRVKQGQQSGPQQGPNVNGYLIFPQTGSGDYSDPSQYCDNGARPESECTPTTCCAEMDIIEANGNAAWATTWHAGYIWPTDYSTQYPPSQPCQQWGCRKDNFFDSASGVCTENGQPVGTSIDSRQPFKVRATFDASGAMTVTFSQGSASVTVNPWDVLGNGNAPTSQTYAIIANNMARYGSVLTSSQWDGWVPLNQDSQSAYSCPSGGVQLSSSTYSVSNLRVKGSLMRGSASVCSGSAPAAPSPTSPPAPLAPPAPSPPAQAGCSADPRPCEGHNDQLYCFEDPSCPGVGCVGSGGCRYCDATAIGGPAFPGGVPCPPPGAARVAPAPPAPSPPAPAGGQCVWLTKNYCSGSEHMCDCSYCDNFCDDQPSGCARACRIANGYFTSPAGTLCSWSAWSVTNPHNAEDGSSCWWMVGDGQNGHGDDCQSCDSDAMKCRQTNTDQQNCHF